MKATQDIILSINSDIANLSFQLKENQEMIHLLQDCHTRLSNEQEDFIANRRLIDQPELESSVWNGNNAERFNKDRTEIEQEITQMNDLVEQQLHDITSKINALENANGTLSSSISSKKFQLSNLK